LKSWVWPGMSKNRYSVVAYYTIDLIYDRMGPGPALSPELIKRSPKNENGYRQNKLFQWLTGDIGEPMLFKICTRLLYFKGLPLLTAMVGNVFCIWLTRYYQKKVILWSCL